jgi:ferric-dicitrate binding protein FerR (iron transport regulator)
MLSGLSTPQSQARPKAFRHLLQVAERHDCRHQGTSSRNDCLRRHSLTPTRPARAAPNLAIYPTLRAMTKRERTTTAAFIIAMVALFYITTNKTLSQMTETDCKAGIIAACQK